VFSVEFYLDWCTTLPSLSHCSSRASTRKQNASIEDRRQADRVTILANRYHDMRCGPDFQFPVVMVMTHTHAKSRSNVKRLSENKRTDGHDRLQYLASASGSITIIKQGKKLSINHLIQARPTKQTHSKKTEKRNRPTKKRTDRQKTNRINIQCLRRSSNL